MVGRRREIEYVSTLLVDFSIADYSIATILSIACILFCCRFYRSLEYYYSLFLLAYCILTNLSCY